ncbi:MULTISPECIES: 2-oxoacid:ferredoxin oxidoreductase subunit beta [Porphyromonadaceae]|uniref:2-oxoacid:ferredoxin oxidoreductase subunit beta n=1 Tax=Sanguibacteroides justesenii TaxID=1547597 RepID=A0A0C3REB9_9PORP|nr:MULTISPECIES: 2-oxoacid:ferredoxin oxidoreductase subunit beta [Porphyromonadaceae]KIO43086.1 2-oxoacid:ferredoxin oxidoreductase subunit beta [Sanguibacteroides justesenii]KIO44801.1 2-oxoacid:ferredoxin oxidoreductase subunit beta [Sanguibacteroides justesenii]MCR9011663.1 2-oxoacid:ferredoxin oxidoreductase subunit beta [Gabonibacter chumensis]PXZ43233.1 2-oxoacid:ferredoxin oxidoreductase subunit beta [Sanguibacteroides justesenii]
MAQYTAKDFKSNQEIRWCPGCGDHGIINAVQKAMAELGYPKESWAVISGIGCSSRFPYYMNTFGFHTIHGRAAAIASGAKSANPNVNILQVSGDGDALAIGGNHFIHSIRRNIDITTLVFNNEIYGLTKGQYSPTTKLGTKTKTSPYGTIETPFNPGELVIGAQGKFFARSLDMNINLTAEVIEAGVRHKGTSVIEVLQNCVIFADGAHAAITDKENKEDRQLILRHGEPMIFGKNRDKGLMLTNTGLKVVEIGKNGITEADILVHDAHSLNPSIHWMLVHMKAPEYPVALGVIRDVEGDTYNDALEAQIEEVKAKSNIRSVTDLLNSGDTWEVK